MGALDKRLRLAEKFDLWTFLKTGGATGLTGKYATCHTKIPVQIAAY